MGSPIALAVLETRQVHWVKRRDWVRGALWLIPTMMTVLAIVVGAMLSRVELPASSPLAQFVFKGNSDEARRLLLTVATSVVGILAFVIGMTLVALQVATARYSPRLLRRFLRDWPAQVVMGVFVGSIAYNASGLYTLGSPDGDIPRLAVTVGIASLFACVGALIFYVDHMIHSIQIDDVIKRVGRETVETIRFEPPGVGGAEGSRLPKLLPVPANAVAIRADKCGYVQAIIPNPMFEVAEDHDVFVQFAFRVGEYVVEGDPIAWAWAENGGVTDDVRASIASGVSRAFLIGFERTTHHDLAIGFEQVVDIATLSMHNYDFHTAVQATNQMAVLLHELASRPLGPEKFGKEGRVIVPALHFADYLDIATGQILRRGASEPVVLRALVGMLRSLEAAVLDYRKPAVRRRIDLVLATAHKHAPDESDVGLVHEGARTALTSTVATEP